MADGYIFDIIKNPERIEKGSLAVKKTDISLTDILYFKPDLRKIPGFNTLAASPVSIEADIKLNGSRL